MSPTEFRLLHYLMLNAGMVLSKAQILVNAWDHDFDGGDNVVELYVGYLRRKIDDGHRPLIHTAAASATSYVTRSANETTAAAVADAGPDAADGHDRIRRLRGLHRQRRAIQSDRRHRRRTGPSGTRSRASRPATPAVPRSKKRPPTDTVDGVAPPVQIVVSGGGELLSPPGESPFSDETLSEISVRSGTLTVDDPRYRVLVTPMDDGAVV